VGTLQNAYKVLYALEHGDKKARYKGEVISPAALDMDEEEWYEIIETLLDEGYITGIKLGTDILGDKYADIKKAKITLKGALYLQENSAFARFRKIATDVITIAKP